MTLRRRALLAASLGLPLVACAPSPLVSGGPAEAWSPQPTVPEQSDTALTAAQTLAAVGANIQAMSEAAAAWEPAKDLSSWQEAHSAAIAEQLARLNSEDLFAEPDPVFNIPPAEVPQAPHDAESARSWFAEETAKHVSDLESLASMSEEQPEKMLYASLACSVKSTARLSGGPAPGDVAPVRFVATSAEPSLQAALTHAWALIRGLEISLGRLSDDEPLREIAQARMSGAKEIRNALRIAAEGSVDQGFDYEMPTPMTTVDEIRAGLGALELHLLEGLMRAFVATDDAEWLSASLGQVDALARVGQNLGYWPGWVAA